jgi:DnaJ-class molecular chaperone
MRCSRCHGTGREPLTKVDACRKCGGRGTHRNSDRQKRTALKAKVGELLE